MEKIIIELKNITKTFGKDTTVIRDINLSIKKGEFVTLLGPSGCGKTTILRMIGGFEEPTSGEILLHDQNINQLTPNKRPINTVFQKYALFPHMNVYENIAFGLRIKNLSPEQIKEKVSHVLEIVDMEGFEKRSISTLSGGQQQRIAIARAIVNEPEILLLDEPLGALDFKMRKEMQLELKEMHKQLGITFLFVTHDQEEAMTMSDRIVVMADGKIQQEGTPEEIYRKPVNAFVADFIGESNIFVGETHGGKKLSFCDTDFKCNQNYPAGLNVEVVIRPEDFTITEPSEGLISGEIISCVFKGTYYETTVLNNKNEFVIYDDESYNVGDMVGLSIKPSDIHVMTSSNSHNHFVGEFNSRGEVTFADITLKPDITKLIPGSYYEDNTLFDQNGNEISLNGVRVDCYFKPSDADLSDNPDEGLVQGRIGSIIYRGDHYNYTVRSNTEEEYFVNDDYLWNTDDLVSVIIPEEKIEYHIIG